MKTPACSTGDRLTCTCQAHVHMRETQTSMHAHPHTHTKKHPYTCACSFACMSSRTQTCTGNHTPAYIQAGTHKHTRARQLWTRDLHANERIPENTNSRAKTETCCHLEHTSEPIVHCNRPIFQSGQTRFCSKPMSLILGGIKQQRHVITTAT